MNDINLIKNQVIESFTKEAQDFWNTESIEDYTADITKPFGDNCVNNVKDKINILKDKIRLWMAMSDCTRSIFDCLIEDKYNYSNLAHLQALTNTLEQIFIDIGNMTFNRIIQDNINKKLNNNEVNN